MKISLNAIKSLGYPELFNLPIEELAAKIGAQLGALEEEPKYPGSLYEGIVVARVVACEPHPNADRLNVCLIDDGGVVSTVERNADGLVQVVCGAPNVKAGLTVAWLPPGATVPASVGKDPFVLGSRELRGIVSNGMLASPSELAISDDHSGILEIDSSEVGEALTKPGTPFKQLYGLDDYVLDIENKMFTHRPDLFGQLGVGREIAGIQGIPFKSPDWFLAAEPQFPQTTAHDLPLRVHNELTSLVPRFVAVPIRGVSVKPSPVWLQSWLTRLGLRPINNIVDLTNYYMMLTGQPLHAYDYDKVKALSGGEVQLVVRNPHPGEKLTLLSGKEIEPRAEAIMIATDQKLIGLGGVMGGVETEVDENTKHIILECANFDMYSIRRTSMAHGLFTDAVTRFNKGQSPLQNTAIAAQTTKHIIEIAGGELAGNVIDDNHLSSDVVSRRSLYPAVTVSSAFINERLGLTLSSAEMKQLLENVECQVHVHGDDLTVTAPFWRTDIELREDVVEEVGRLYGYDKLPLTLPKRTLTPVARNNLLDIKDTIRNKLSRAGANEVLTYSFVHQNLLEKVGQNPDEAFQLSNALSPDLQFYRLNLIPSLLEKIHPNIKAGYDNFALFEIGKTHGINQPFNEDQVPQEFEALALVVTAADKLQKHGAAYYDVKKYLDYLVDDLVYKPISGELKQHQVAQPYDQNRVAVVYLPSGEMLGIIGEFTARVRRNLKLPTHSAGFEVDLTALEQALQSSPYVSLPRYPRITQDISLKVPVEVPYQDLLIGLKQELTEIQPPNTLPVVSPIDIYQRSDDTEHKQITFRLSIASYERTMTDAEVNKLLDAVAHSLQQKIGAERI